MMHRRALLTAVVGALLWLAAPQVRAAQVAPEVATQMISSMGEAGINQLTSSSIAPEERAQRFRSLLHQYFDVDYMGRFVLGKYWKGATEAERQEYMKLFEDWLVNAYASRFAEYTGEQFKVVGAKPGNGYTSVVSEILRPSGETFQLIWFIVDRNGTPKIIDASFENQASMAQTHRDEFASVIQRNGGQVEGLLKALREKTVQQQ